MRVVLRRIVFSRVDGHGEMAGALRGHAQAVVAGVPDDRDDVGDRLGEDDGHGPLVDGEVPGQAG
ncbi:MAG: hypothetical protein ACRDNG_10205 [Gaiellaceae bacterium]